MISNIVRIYGKMDFHLFPFGFVGNGDYYCFYKYWENREDYFVGIWLHETNNFVVLCKTFKAFMYSRRYKLFIENNTIWHKIFEIIKYIGSLLWYNNELT